MKAKPYTVIAGGVRLAVRLTPRAAHDRVDGIMTGADGRAVLQIRLTAPPVEGAANEALIAFVAKTLGLRRSDITIRSGEKGRNKVLDLAGTAAELTLKLAALA